MPTTVVGYANEHKVEVFECIADSTKCNTAKEYSDHIHSSRCGKPVEWSPSIDYISGEKAARRKVEHIGIVE